METNQGYKCFVKHYFDMEIGIIPHSLKNEVKNRIDKVKSNNIFFKQSDIFCKNINCDCNKVHVQ